MKYVITRGWQISDWKNPNLYSTGGDITVEQCLKELEGTDVIFCIDHPWDARIIRDILGISIFKIIKNSKKTINITPDDIVYGVGPYKDVVTRDKFHWC